jgi:hypothetical protein
MPLRGSWAASVSLSAPLLLSTRGLERASKLPLMLLAIALLTFVKREPTLEQVEGSALGAVLCLERVHLGLGLDVHEGASQKISNAIILESPISNSPSH